MQKHNEDFSLVEAWLRHVVSEETRDWSGAAGAYPSIVVPNSVIVLWGKLPTTAYYTVFNDADRSMCALRLDMFIKAHQKLAGETL